MAESTAPDQKKEPTVLEVRRNRSVFVETAVRLGWIPVDGMIKALIELIAEYHCQFEYRWDDPLAHNDSDFTFSSNGAVAKIGGQPKGSHGVWSQYTLSGGSGSRGVPSASAVDPLLVPIPPAPYFCIRLAAYRGFAQTGFSQSSIHFGIVPPPPNTKAIQTVM